MLYQRNNDERILCLLGLIHASNYHATLKTNDSEMRVATFHSFFVCSEVIVSVNMLKAKANIEKTIFFNFCLSHLKK